MNWLAGWSDEPLAHRLGWALVHSLWQGAIVAALFGALRLSWRRLSARIRYWVACLALLLIFLAPAATLLSGWGAPRGVRGGGWDEAKDGMTHDAGEARAAGSLVVAESFLTAAAPWAGALEHGLPWVVVCWLCGVVGFSCRWVQGSRWVRRVRTVETAPLEREWLERLNDLRLRMEVSRPVRLLRSALIDVPMVVGWLRPVILLPASTLCGLTPDQLEAILAHELAHVRRHDYLVNCFQALIETLLFYHPAVWWISGCIREEREHCCDDLVLEVCEDRLAYARALVTQEERRGMPALALAASGGSLLQRIRRLLGAAPADQPVSPVEFGGLALLGAGVVLVVTGVCFWIGPAAYQAKGLLRIERKSPIAVTSDEGRVMFTFYDPAFLETEARIISSPIVLDRVIEPLGLRRVWYGNKEGEWLSSQEALQRLTQRLRLRPIKNTSLLEVRVTAPDPRQAAATANAIMTAYRDVRWEAQRNRAAEPLRVMENRLKQQDTDIAQAQRRMDDLRVQLGMPKGSQPEDASAAEGASSPRLSAESLRRIEALRIETRAQITQQEALLKKLKELDFEGQTRALPAAGVQDALLTSLQEQLDMAEQKLVRLRVDYGPNHPDLTAAKETVKDMREKVRVRVQGILLGLEAKLDSLRAGEKGLAGEVNAALNEDLEQAKLSRPYWEAKQQLDEKIRFRAALFTKLAAEQADSALPRSPEVEVVEEATPPLPAKALNRAQGATAALAGVVLAAAGLFLARLGGRKEPAAAVV